MIATDPLSILLVEVPVQLADFLARGALGSQLADPTDSRGRLVDADPGAVVVAAIMKCRPSRAGVDILRQVIAEITLAEEAAGTLVVGQRQIRSDTSLLQ